jgi:hypothetical protein
LGFADEMRVGLRGLVRRVWARRGVKVHQRLQLAYHWRYLFLVVNAQAGQLQRTPKTHWGSYRGLGWSAEPPERMGQGVGDAINRVATMQSGTQSSGTGVSGGAAGYWG